jgi:hypothetical protein
MAKKEDIKPIYSELQGYLSKAPSSEDGVHVFRESNLWKNVNQTIDELNNITGENYNRFKMEPYQSGKAFYVSKETYKGKLAGLIARLHGKYFANEPAPFSDMPGMVISQTQMQSQTQTQMILDLQSKIDEQLRNFKPGDKKHTFLEKVKGALATVKDYSGFIALCITTAKEVGLSLGELSELFK